MSGISGGIVSVTLLAALLIQASAIGLLRLGLGKGWLRRPVTLLVLASAVYQGLSQILLASTSIRAWDGYRTGLQQDYVDMATLIMSAGMLAFTVAYLLTKPGRYDAVASEDDVVVAARGLDWRLLALACAPLAVLTYAGRGYNNAVPMGASTPLASDLAATFFVITVVLAAAGLLLRHGTRWLLPVLLAQSLLLAAAGERTPVITDAIALILLLARAGRRPSGRQLRAAAGLTVVAILAITGVRAEQGRMLDHKDSGLRARASALGDAITTVPGAPGTGPGLVAQAAVRLDGASFAGAILQAESLGYPRLSATYVPGSLLLAVPSAAWPSKLDDAALNPYQTEVDDFGLQQVNYLPTFPGLYMGFLSPAWLIVFLALAGVLSGWAERLLLRRFTLGRLILLVGTVQFALGYEGGLAAMLLAFRPAVVIAIAVKLFWSIPDMRKAHAGKPRAAYLLAAAEGAGHDPAQ